MKNMMKKQKQKKKKKKKKKENKHTNNGFNSLCSRYKQTGSHKDVKQNKTKKVTSAMHAHTI